MNESPNALPTAACCSGVRPVGGDVERPWLADGGDAGLLLCPSDPGRRGVGVEHA